MNSLIKILSSTIFAVNTVSFVVENNMKSYEKIIYEPLDSVSIVMASYNEERFIEESLLSIRNQTIIRQYPEYFQLVLVDSNSTDKTVEKAKKYVDSIINVPIRGKLTARNIATNEARGNIIVSVDADCYYPDGWLNSLLEPFNNYTNPDNQNVIAVNGSTIDKSIPNIPTSIRNVAELVQWILYRNKLLGRNSALWKHGFYQVGKFQENINQFNLAEINKEEEYDFGDRLAKLGKVVQKHNASCVHLGGSRIGCRLGIENKEVCDKFKIGIERFG